MSGEVCSAVTRLVAQQPFRRKIGQQKDEIAKQFLDQGRSRLRKPKLPPNSDSRRWCPGNLGDGESNGPIRGQTRMRDGTIRGGLEIRPIPGRHFEIMKEPHVRTLAAELAECLEERHARYAPKSNRLVAVS